MISRHLTFLSVLTVGGGKPGFDLRDSDKVDLGAKGKYSTVSTICDKFYYYKCTYKRNASKLKELFGNKAAQIISKHASQYPWDTPFFMYLSFQSVHGPLEVRYGSCVWP